MRIIKAWRVMFYTLLMVVVAGGASNDISAQQTGEDAAWREMNNRARQVEPLMREAARLYQVDPRALWTIAYLETRFRPELISPKGARGMMQFMPATAARFGLSNPHDTTAAIYAAARYVRYLQERFGNRFELILAGYNAGEGAVDAYLRGIALRTLTGRIINPQRINTGGIPPFAETRNYVARGLQVMNAIAASNVFTTIDLAATRALPAVPSTQPLDQSPQASRADPNLSLTALTLPALALSISPPKTAVAPQSVVSQTEGDAPVSRYAVASAPEGLKDKDSSTVSAPSPTDVRPRSFKVNAAAAVGAGAPPPPGRSVRAQR